MKKVLSMISIAMVAVQQTEASRRDSEYDSADWLKIYSGVTAGMMTAFVVD